MKNLILIFLLFLSNGLFAQLTIRVENLEISNIIYAVDWHIIEEDDEKGPYLKSSCVIENNTDTVVTLCIEGDESLATFNYIYNYEGVKYVKYIGGMLRFFSRAIIGNDTLRYVPSLIKIQPYNSVKLVGVSYIFNTELLLPVKKDTKFVDYTDRLLQVLPTLHIEYEDENLKIRASEIERVTLNRDTLYP